MKISDLTKIWPSQPRIVRVHKGGIVHIVERNGEKRVQHIIDRRSITNCNRLMKWPNVERRWDSYRLCPTCGGEHPKQTFLDAAERGRQWKREYEAKRERERWADEARNRAAYNWQKLWDDVSQSFEEHIEHMIESDIVLIPIEKKDVTWLRFQINLILSSVEGKDLKSEYDVETMHRAHRLVNDVLIGD